MPPEANRIIGKFIRRAFWMNDPTSLEFRLFFMEMITEMRNLSGRNFNADITLSDLKRTLTNITDKYPALKSISVNTVFKTINTMDSFAKAGDLFSIASAVSASFLSIGTLFIGPLPYMLLKIFAPGRLKCGVIMGLGGLIGIELYDIKPLQFPPVKKRMPYIAIASGLSVPVLISLALFLDKAPVLLRISSFACSIFLFLIFLAGIGLFRLESKKEPPMSDTPGPDTFDFQPDGEDSLFSNFRLDPEEARFLFSLYYQLTEDGIEAVSDPGIKANKSIWLDKWKNNVEKELHSSLAAGREVLKKAIFGPMQKLPRIKISIIFMECALFRPFFPLEELTGLSIPGGINSISLKSLNDLALEMGVPLSPGQVRNIYHSAVGALNTVNILKQMAQNFISPSLSRIPPIAVIQSEAGIVKTSGSVNIAGAGSLPGLKGLTEGADNYIIGGGIMLEKELFPLLCRISAASSYSFLCQAARLETVFRIVLNDLPDYPELLESLIELLKNLRIIFIKSYNIRGLGSEELRASLHFLEIFIKRTGDLLRQVNKKKGKTVS